MVEYHSDESGKHPKRLPAFPRQGWRAFRTEDELRELFKEYFKYCVDANEPSTRVGLSLWLGMVKATFRKYANGEYDDAANKYSEACTEAIEFVENNKLIGGLKGLYNPQITKFDLENNHGYKEVKALQGVADAPPIKVVDETPRKPATEAEAKAAWEAACREAVDATK